MLRMIILAKPKSWHSHFHYLVNQVMARVRIPGIADDHIV